MFELPEFITLARQLNETVVGKTIRSGSLGNSPHKFVWYNRSPEEFAGLTAGKTAGPATTRGKFLFVPLEPGYVLLLGDCGGRLLYHAPGDALPDRVHLSLAFEDGSTLTAFTQMWGAYELFEAGQEWGRPYVRGMRPIPVEPDFTSDYFTDLIAGLLAGPKRSVKALLTTEGFTPGLGNAIAQDIMFRARLHPRHALGELGTSQQRALYDAILVTVQAAIAGGGRYDELDLYGRPGGYVRLMDNRAVGQPCPKCGAPIEKIQYLGGACYLCPRCQV